MRVARIISVLLVLLCGTLLSAAGQDGSSIPANGDAKASTEAAPTPTTISQPNLPVSPPPEYKIQPEDAFRMSVWGEPDLAIEQVVDPNGYVNIPQVGPIHAEGLTVQELLAKITEGLSKILREPRVQITMLNYRKPKVYVLGQVNRPGLHEIKFGDRVMEAIAQAGSFTDMAYLEGATITHQVENKAVPLDLKALFYGGDMSKNVVLQDGDTIYIPEDTVNKYYVLGEVMRPGMFRLKDNVTVVDAITNAGGPTQRGSIKATCIIRGNPENPQRIKIDITKLVKGSDLSQNVPLQPGDVVYVPETSKPDWNKIAGIVSAVVNSSYLLKIWGL